MSPRRWGALAGVAGLVALSGLSTRAGGLLDRGGIEVLGPSPIPGQLLVRLANDRWAESCLPVRFSLNTTQDPIATPDGSSGMSLAEVRTATAAALATWTNVPTSYIDMRLDGTTANTGPAGFDFVNEVTFVPGQPVEFASAYSASYFVASDFEVADGLDADGDGDADFSSAAGTCRDIDGDGDIELPPGLYKAGTIIDTDVVGVVENTHFANLAEVDLPPFGNGTYDLQGILVHEFGHSHGLAHSNLDDTHVDGGPVAVMNPGGYGYDGYLSMRTLTQDDLGWSSYWYPEGTAKTGPAALQKGDAAFAARYSVISGEVKDRDGHPVATAFPYAVTLDGRIAASAMSGNVRLSLEPGVGYFLLPPEHGIPDGSYVLPVPKGVYKIGLEANDGLPALQLSTSASREFIASLYGIPVFNEEFWSGPLEHGDDAASGLAVPVVALWDRPNIDFVVDATTQIMATTADVTDTFGAISSSLLIPSGWIAASRISTERLLAAANGRPLLVKQAVFGLEPLAENDRVRLPEVMITTGVKHADGSVTIDLQHPLVRDRQFALQGTELTPLHVPFSEALGAYVTTVLPRTGRDLFVVARFSDRDDPRIPGLGVTDTLIYVDPPAPGAGINDSYLSLDGGQSYVPLIGDPWFGVVVGTK